MKCRFPVQSLAPRCLVPGHLTPKSLHILPSRNHDASTDRDLQFGPHHAKQEGRKGKAQAAEVADAAPAPAEAWS